MTKDRLVARQRLAIVHQSIARAHAPQRRGPQLVARRCPTVLDHAVTRADVVQQKVAERMDYLITQSHWNRECATIDGRSRSCGLECSCMTYGTANRIEE